jgi:hypothetical protein
VGAVLLANAEAGIELPPVFVRKLLEILFDAKPEAEARLAIAAANRRDDIAAEHRDLTVPADALAAAKLAHKYVNSELGEIVVKSESGNVYFDFGRWHSKVATRNNGDGSTSFVTIDPTVDGYEFTADQRNGQLTLSIRDAQHEYTYVEISAGTSTGE